jgi:hypothetical protein
VKGYRWNHKRVYRIYRKLELNLRIKPRKRIVREKPQPLGKRPAQPPVTHSARAASCAFSDRRVTWNQCQCGARLGSRMLDLGVAAA